MTDKTKKTYMAAPLPFMGQKRRFAADFKEALNNFSEKTVFIDLFGGSGLLSHLARTVRPDAQIIYNDYDDYHLRIENIERTNALLADIRQMTAIYPREKKLPQEVKEAILRRIRKEEKSGFVDYITLSASLLFSMNYATSYEQLKAQTFYNSVRKEDYSCDGYLNGIEVVKCDYRDLYNQYKDRKDVIFFIDPPYLSTETGAYKCYWKLNDYLDVLNILNGISYFYFTSNKSSLIELLEWTERNLNAENPFKNAVKKEVRTSMNYNASFIDIMLYKKNEIRAS